MKPAMTASLGRQLRSARRHSRFRALILHVRSRRRMQMEGEEQLREELRFADSHGLLPAVLALAAAPDFTALLRDAWPSCGDITEWSEDISAILQQAKREGQFPLPAPKYDAKATTLYDALPNVVTVYQGCYPDHVRGFSYHIDPLPAARVPFMARCGRRRAKNSALLLEFKVAKRDIAFIVADRGKQEVVVHADEIRLMTQGRAWDALFDATRVELRRGT